LNNDTTAAVQSFKDKVILLFNYLAPHPICSHPAISEMLPASDLSFKRIAACLAIVIELNPSPLMFLQSIPVHALIMSLNKLFKNYFTNPVYKLCQFAGRKQFFSY
jgi:hypothetical protein